MNIFDMMKNVKAMQGDLKNIRVTGYAGGDMVTITIDGKFKVMDVSISEQAINTQDAKVISDLVKAAFHDAMQKVQQQIQQKLGTSGIGNMLGGMFNQ